MRTQAEKFDAQMINGDISAVDLTGQPVKLLTDAAGTVQHARPSSSRPAPATVATASSSDRDIIGAGGRDTAMKETTFLTRFTKP